LGSIPIIDWAPAYIADFTGSMIGLFIVFYLGKKYGFTFLEKIFDKNLIAKLKNIKIKKHKEIESVFMLRLFGGTVVEIAYYGTSLLKIKFSNFLLSSVPSHFVYGIPTFYFANNIISGRNTMINIVFIIIATTLVLKFKTRYLKTV